MVVPFHKYLVGKVFYIGKQARQKVIANQSHPSKRYPSNSPAL
jgi:hypothetical protein